MKKILLLGIVFVICLISYFSNYVTKHVFPNTFFDSVNVSYLPKDAVLKMLARTEATPITIDIKGRIYTYSLSELGIVFDINKTVDAVFFYEHEGFPKNIITYVTALYSQRMIQPQLVFTQEFYERFSNTVFDFSAKPDEISVNDEGKQLVFRSYEEKYSVEPKSLAQTITAQFGKAVPIKANFIKVTSPEKSVTVNTYNENLGRITAKPVVISLPYVGSSLTIQHEEFKKLLRVRYNGVLQQLSIDIDEDSLKQYVQAQLTAVLQRKDLTVDMQDLKKNLVSLATSRFNAFDASVVQASVIQTAQSHGEIAKKYIEIDIRQQMMYLWENGQNIATHRISSGLYYPTPPGTYKIMNKAPNAFSDIYHVWMPYWMAFYLDPKINAYLGIHELPYWVTGDGTQIRRPRDFIGSPHTGGCVSLDVGEAQLVYNWAEIGMPVVIYE